MLLGLKMCNSQARNFGNVNYVKDLVNDKYLIGERKEECYFIKYSHENSAITKLRLRLSLALSRKKNRKNRFNLKHNYYVKSNLLAKIMCIIIDNEVWSRHKKLILRMFNSFEVKKNFFRLKRYGFMLDSNKIVQENMIMIWKIR